MAKGDGLKFFLNIFLMWTISFLFKGCFYYLFKNEFIYFNWRLITLQYCGGFCPTLTWISHGFTCVPSSWTPFLWVVPDHWLWVSCFMHQLALVICFTYGNKYVSMLFSQIITPFLAFSHRVQKSILYICVSFAVLHIGSLLLSF